MMLLQVRWPNQQCQSTEGGWLVIQIALHLTRLISPCYNNTTCMHIQWHTKKSKHSEWTLWDEAKSGWLNLWAAPMIVQLYEATQYHYYRAVLAIFPLTPDQIRAQIWRNGVRGGRTTNRRVLLVTRVGEVEFMSVQMTVWSVNWVLFDRRPAGWSVHTTWI